MPGPMVGPGPNRRKSGRLVPDALVAACPVLGLTALSGDKIDGWFTSVGDLLAGSERSCGKGDVYEPA